MILFLLLLNLQRKANKKKKEWIKSWTAQSSKLATCSQDSLIVISPEKTKSVSNIRATSYSDSESDCEIIEQITPIIEIDIDDDCVDEPTESITQNETSETIESAVEQICASVPSNEVTTQLNSSFDSNVSTEGESIVASREVTTEPKSKSPEPDALFFIDKNPATSFEAPIYEINPGPSTICNQNMAQNLRITFQNKENHANFDNSFAPNPLLSSTHLNTSFGEIEENTRSLSNNDLTPQQPKNFHISINSTCENGISRRVSIGKTSPNLSPNHADNNALSSSTRNNNNINNNNDNINKNSNNSSTPKAIKRKADHDVQAAPPSKRSHSESSDVIILNDTITDEEDSVVFVSETLDHQKRNRIDIVRKNAARGKAADFISLRNDKPNQNMIAVS